MSGLFVCRQSEKWEEREEFKSTINHSTACRWLVSRRLGNQISTGKIANRTAVIAGLTAHLTAQRPELIAPIFNAPKGAEPLTDPEVCAQSLSLLSGAVLFPTTSHLLRLSPSSNQQQSATLSSLAALYVNAPSFVAGTVCVFTSALRLTYTALDRLLTAVNNTVSASHHQAALPPTWPCSGGG